MTLKAPSNSDSVKKKKQQQPQVEEVQEITGQ